jgi:hypothetical protein
MTDKKERERRKQLARAISEKARSEAEARMPISSRDLDDLFTYLDEALPERGCDHSLTLTRTFLASRALDAEAVVPWLGEYGGFCDCEVLANVGDAWQQ